MFARFLYHKTIIFPFTYSYFLEARHLSPARTQNGSRSTEFYILEGEKYLHIYLEFFYKKNLSLLPHLFSHLYQYELCIFLLSFGL